MSSYLNELCRFYARMQNDPSSPMPHDGMSAENISFVLNIDENGQLLKVEDIRDSKGRPKRMFVPAAAKRTVGVLPYFLWDNTGYVLGVDGKGKPQRTVQTFDAFRKQHEDLLADCDDIHARALLAFLHDWKPEQFNNLDNRDALLDSNVVFRLNTEKCLFHEVSALKDIWLKTLHKTPDVSALGVCLVSGHLESIARIHPSIKGVVGAQSSGAALVSFNCAAFTSYGKEQSANSPVSEHAARAYTSALNYLLQRDHEQMVRIGDTCMVFWADKASPAEKLFGGFFDFPPAAAKEQDNAQVQRLQGILQALRRGASLNEADRELESGSRFYVLGLAPNAARLSVRFWLTDTLDVLLRHVSSWYEDLRIERKFPDSEPEFPPLWLLLSQTVAAQGKIENIPPGIGGQMIRAFLGGSKLPENVFGTVLQRIHADKADKKVQYYRAALIKAYLRRNLKEVNDMTTLNTEEQSMGYRLGRLFALLDKTQQDALGTVNAGLRERYIGAASATPRLVFPMLLRLTQHHVTKVRKNRFEGFEVMFNKTISDILNDMTDFPATLPLAEQGRFMLGYYHQTNAFYQKKSDTTETNE
ncbi:MAG: type I-C CRISPR-associated protein Cas8c/Csd1 [Desulfovibrio sp.]|nr:type I-C CRISPR-associated protein Cas8c/Csd1 [Desulfovibrio sp.]